MGTDRHQDPLWAAVADPTRRRLLDALLTSGAASATTLAGALPVTRQAVAKHLAVLDRAGLVEGTRGGREMLYTVRLDRLNDASRAIANIAAGWEDRLAAIKLLAETERQNRDHGPRVALRVHPGHRTHRR
jgi:ArsR family transcriptional regulator, cadmium/lead-responsive transcriptional repressor